MTLPTAPSRTMSQDTFDSTTDAFIGALPQFETDMNALAAAMTLNATTDTSASSVLIGTGAKTFTVSAGKSFWPGMWLVIADTAAPTTNAMFCQVTSYSGTTLIVNSYAVQGSGTKSAWQISQSAPAALDSYYMRADQTGSSNLVINGGMQVNQAPTAALSGTLQFGSVDMMIGALAGSAASGTLTQATNATISPATTKCLHLSGISFTSGYASAGTRIKASRTAELNGKTISVRARVYHDFGVGCPVAFVLNKANSADVFSAVTNISINGGTTVATATATEITGTFTLGATDGNTGLELLVQGTSTQTVASKNFYIGELEMWIGSAPTTFRANSYEQDLLDCLPYYFSTFPKGTAPAQNAGGTGIVYRMPVNNVASGVYLNFPVPMRATPSTMTGYNPSVANANWRNFSINADSAAVAFTTTTARGTFLDNASVAGDLQTHALRCHVTADARLF